MSKPDLANKARVYTFDNRPKIQLDNEEIRKIEVVKEMTGIKSRNAIIKLALRLLFTRHGIF